MKDKNNKVIQRDLKLDIILIIYKDTENLNI